MSILHMILYMNRSEGWVFLDCSNSASWQRKRSKKRATISLVDRKRKGRLYLLKPLSSFERIARLRGGVSAGYQEGSNPPFYPRELCDIS